MVFHFVRDERLETYSCGTGCRYFISTLSYKVAGNLFSPLAYKLITRNKKLRVISFVRDERLELPTFAV